MKKILSLVLAAVMIAGIITMSGCTTLQKDANGNLDRGAEITMYLTNQVYNFDPQVSINDVSRLKVLSLLFEGLTTLNSSGKWQKAMMSGYTVVPDDLDGYSVLISIGKSKWTDGRTVQAGDFVYSWKRLLDPNNKGEAASLLYEIKNARLANLGDCSIDDVGISAVDTYTLKVTFENSNVDLDRFFTNTSSIMLVPLREDCLTMYGEFWARRANAIITNGPFCVRVMEKDGTYRLERSGYYYRDTEKNEYLDKYVIPYRLITNYEIGDLADQMAAYEEGSLFFIGELPLDQRAELEREAVTSDMLATECFYFNTENSTFRDAKVRQALSLALDREHIAELLTFADAATGFIPYGVFDVKTGSSFRKTGGDLIATSADADAAKALLKEAGVSGGSFSITVRDDEADRAVADYAAEVWGDLGFIVTVEVTGTGEEKVDETEGTFYYVIDDYQVKYDSGEFDVILADMTMASPDPFGALSQFAGDFSGNGVDMDSDTYDVYKHVTGYENDSYMALIEEAFAAENASDRVAKLHEAEQLLIDDMPVCPVVFLKSAYVSSNILSGIKTTYYGTVDFRRTKMKNYMEYKTEEAE